MNTSKTEELTSSYDYIIIGSGQAGNPLATKLSKAGKKTALIERKLIGGSCINAGCMPTKTLIASAHVAHLVRKAADFGVHAENISVDMPAVMRRKEAVVNKFRMGSANSLQKQENLDIIFGEARFTSPETLIIKKASGEEYEITAETIIINTGTRATPPRVDNLDKIDYLNNETVMQLDELPRHLVIIGGGYIGLEYAQMFRRLGSYVTVVENGAVLAKEEEPEISKEVERLLRAEDIHIFKRSRAVSVRQAPANDADNRMILTIQTAAGAVDIAGSHLLVAAGRTPNSDSLDLHKAGVEVDKKGFVVTNDYLETTQPHIFTAGDAKGGHQFTHISYDDHRLLANRFLKHEKKNVNDRLLCYTMFLDPQLGRVGLTEKQAREKGYNVQAFRLPASRVARCITNGQADFGLMKLIADKDSKQILGATILLPEGGELMTAIQIAMMGKLPYTALQDAIIAHPLLSEAFNTLTNNPVE